MDTTTKEAASKQLTPHHIRIPLDPILAPDDPRPDSQSSKDRANAQEDANDGQRLRLLRVDHGCRVSKEL